MIQFNTGHVTLKKCLALKELKKLCENGILSVTQVSVCFGRCFQKAARWGFLLSTCFRHCGTSYQF